MGGIAVIFDICDAVNASNINKYEKTYNLLTEVTFVVTLCINLSVTGLIAGRLWYMGRRVREAGGQEHQGYSRVVLVLVESGALYAANQLIYLAAFMSKTVSDRRFSLRASTLAAQRALLTVVYSVADCHGSDGGYQSQDHWPRPNSHPAGKY